MPGLKDFQSAVQRESQKRSASGSLPVARSRFDDIEERVAALETAVSGLLCSAGNLEACVRDLEIRGSSPPAGE